VPDCGLAFRQALCGVGLVPNRLWAAEQNALNPAGIQAAHIADLWHGTLWICGLVFVGVLVALGWALLRRGSKPIEEEPRLERQTERSAKVLVSAASILSIVLLVGLVTADVLTDHALSALPAANAVRVRVVGHQWWWEVQYGPHGADGTFTTANEMHVPVGRPVIVELDAADVIHTFWVPNLHGKKDMIPGRPTTIVFRADRPGAFRGQCAEFCGAEHALMAFPVVAEPEAAFRRWEQQQAALTLPPVDENARRGQSLFQEKDCAKCHTVRGTSATGTVGPDLTHLSSRETLAAGTVANAPANLAKWISAPGSIKPGTTMPATALSAEELRSVVAYLAGLR
jgi:cytochrome c oxidase subunit 2